MVNRSSTRSALALLVLSLIGCGGAEASSDTDELANPTPPSSDAGAGADASGTFASSVTPEPPPECPTLEPCHEFGDLFALVYESPANVELRDARGSFLLAFDSDAHAFVAYDAAPQMNDPNRLDFVEVRFDPRYDRVSVDRSGQALACEGASCDLVTFEAGDAVSTAHVPDELEARDLQFGCVAGAGIACFDEATKSWKVRLPPGALEHPIVAFAPLGGRAFVASDGRGDVFMIDRGHVTPLDVGTSEPIVSLTAGWQRNPQRWAGRTASGRLVVGSYEGGVLCDVELDRVSIEYGGALYGQRSDELVRQYFGCDRAELPAEISGLGEVGCGISNAPYVFDAHRVYAMPIRCVMD